MLSIIILSMLLCVVFQEFSLAQNTTGNSSVGGYSGGIKQAPFKQSFLSPSYSKSSFSSNKLGSYSFKYSTLRQKTKANLLSWPRSNKENSNQSFMNLVSPAKGSRNSFSSFSPFGNTHRMPSIKEHKEGELRSSFEQTPYRPPVNIMPLNYFHLDAKDKQEKSTVIAPNKNINPFGLDRRRDKNRPLSVSSTFINGPVPNKGAVFGTGAHIPTNHKYNKGGNSFFKPYTSSFQAPITPTNLGLPINYFHLDAKNKGSRPSYKTNLTKRRLGHNGLSMSSSFNQMSAIPSVDGLPINYFHLDGKSSGSRPSYTPNLSKGNIGHKGLSMPSSFNQYPYG
ncbi:MAG: hypothetical protein HRT72_08750, partial [Flavobacteriales bacterium]|nr:hypothetical protein [Flavobacteriales bacterium]